jgi:hypothetical protein
MMPYITELHVVQCVKKKWISWIAKSTIWSPFIELYWGLTLKDPCKKCLVRACCSQECEHKIMVNNFIFPYDKVSEKRNMAYLVLGNWLFAIIWFIVLAIRTFS